LRAFAAKFYPTLEKTVKSTLMLARKDFVIEVVGLSSQRAMQVKEFLAVHGIRKDRVVVHGYGEDKPIVNNKTKEGQAKNRRIELKLITVPAKKR
jgi:hypothetical protein